MVHTEAGSKPEGGICLVHGNISNERWKGAHLSYISVTAKAACFFNQIPSREILPRASPTPELLYFFLPAADYFENDLPGVPMIPEPCHHQHVSRPGSFSRTPTASLSRWPQLYPSPGVPLFTRPTPPPPPPPESILQAALNLSTNLHGPPPAWIKRAPGKVWPRSMCVAQSHPSG